MVGAVVVAAAAVARSVKVAQEEEVWLHLGGYWKERFGDGPT